MNAELIKAILMVNIVMLIVLVVALVAVLHLYMKAKYELIKRKRKLIARDNEDDISKMEGGACKDELSEL
ncbi:MAG: hypothetical protein LUD27_02315 [Clostridia bacterium]|nr:hypothetical protein [Clostridia bacterium]